MKVHPSITTDRVLALVGSNMFGMTSCGICLECGNDQSGCEPDAREYVCESCGEPKVYGAEEVIMMGAYHGN